MIPEGNPFVGIFSLRFKMDRWTQHFLYNDYGRLRESSFHVADNLLTQNSANFIKLGRRIFRSGDMIGFFWRWMTRRFSDDFQEKLTFLDEADRVLGNTLDSGILATSLLERLCFSTTCHDEKNFSLAMVPFFSH